MAALNHCRLGRPAACRLRNHRIAGGERRRHPATRRARPQLARPFLPAPDDGLPAACYAAELLSPLRRPRRPRRKALLALRATADGTAGRHAHQGCQHLRIAACRSGPPRPPRLQPLTGPPWLPEDPLLRPANACGRSTGVALVACGAPFSLAPVCSKSMLPGSWLMTFGHWVHPTYPTMLSTPRQDTTPHPVIYCDDPVPYVPVDDGAQPAGLAALESATSDKP